MSAKVFHDEDGGCFVRVKVTWVCSVCGRQTVTLEGEDDGPRPFICEGFDSPHRTVEMEQRLPEAFVAADQYIGKDAASPTEKED